MSLLAIATGFAMLYPVELQDPVLREDDTFISEAARTHMGPNNLGTLHCLDTDEMRGYERICLTTGEWQEIFDRIAASDAASNRDRQIGLGQWRSIGAGGRSALTP